MSTSAIMSPSAGQPSGSTQRTLLGHPLGLYVLFFTEMWERFSFYGMKALLVLYMLNHFFWPQKSASYLLGWYAMLAYGLNPIGGFIADRFLGARKAVFIGGVLIVIGQFLLVNESLPFLYAGLVFLICGVGLLKPNISTQVGNLYKPGDTRRDGAFTIFYMGINLGAFLGPIFCGFLQEYYGFGYAFGAAGVGMILGLIVYVFGQRKLIEFRQDVGDHTGGKNAAAATAAKQPWKVVLDRILVLLIVFLFVILFWTAFEQSANVAIVWADKHTNLRPFDSDPPPITLPEAPAASAPAEKTSWWKFSITAAQTQSINPFFIITLAPVAAFLWLWLDRRGRQPSAPTKMVLGVTGVGVAFLVLWPAAVRENGPSSAALIALPAGVSTDNKGVFTKAADGKPTYYGLSRLRYDSGTRQLRLEGVLPDNDRLRLLAETAPAALKQTVESLVKKSAEQAENAARGESWQLSEVLAAAPPGLQIAGDEAPKILRWDTAANRLTVTGEIKERAKMELLAAAAEPDFKKAVDKLFLESSRYRVSVWWLAGFFLVLTLSELCLSPVGLSLVTKLAPPKHVGLCMGGWFLATAIAEMAAQIFGAMWGTMPPGKYFMIFVVMCCGGGLIMALLIRSLKRMMHGVQ
jgi:POT family proton-dependent oligopeptide transporter